MKKHMMIPLLLALAGLRNDSPQHNRGERFFEPPEVKECFRKGCNNKRGKRGLYCSAECHRIDS